MTAQPTKPTKPQRFALAILGASEDLPRLITAYGRACGGEFAFAIRPRDNTALLIHQVAKQPAMVWRTDLGLAPSHAPELSVTPDVALGELRTAKSKPPPAGPATLKGKWAGHLFCTDGTPSVKLERKVASYGTLKLSSAPDGRWAATFDRGAKWFSKQKQESVVRSSLAEAIQAGMGLVIGLVSEACSFRDTHRRNAVDPEFALRYPAKAEREPKDRTDRYKGKASYSARQAENGWAVVNAVGMTVSMYGPKDKAKAQKHAAALTRGTPVAVVPQDMADAFGLGGMPHVVIAPSMDAIPLPRVPSGGTAAAAVVVHISDEAHAIESMADSLWGSAEAPELLLRAGKLIRHAQALVRSPLCSGKEQKMAIEDVRRAADAYQQAHAALSRGEKADIVTTLRRIAERVALAAARAGKQCAGGQKKLDIPHRTADQAATSIGQREAGWTWGDRVSWKGRFWIVRDVRADGTVDVTIEGSDLADTAPASELRAARAGAAPPHPAVAMQPVWPPAAPPQRVATTRAPRTPKPAAGADPAKDRVLMDAFAQAIAAAAQSMRPAATRESMPAVIRHRALTDAEHTAIANYAKEKGRSWKQALNDDWSNARTRGPLQRLRNDLGPEWLQGFKLTTRETCPVPPVRTRAVSR